MNMICSTPYRPGSGVVEYACGRCMPCRLSRRKTWTARAVLESLAHRDNSFVTLTYDKANYPTDGSLAVSELQKFVRSIRDTLGPVRFLGVGEYGSQTWRAHYHLLLFGMSPTSADLLRCWKKGHVSVGTLTTQSAQYVSGYIVKRLNKDERNEEVLRGRHPEFMRCSLRPGIGAGALDMLEDVNRSEAGQRHIAQYRDVLKTVRFEGRVWYIGRYLTSKLRQRLGLPDSDPLRVLAQSEEMEAARGSIELAELYEAKREGTRRVAEWKAKSRTFVQSL